MEITWYWFRAIVYVIVGATLLGVAIISMMPRKHQGVTSELKQDRLNVTVVMK